MATVISRNWSPFCALLFARATVWRRRKKHLLWAILVIILLILTVLYSRPIFGTESDKPGVASVAMRSKDGKGFLNIATWKDICGHQMKSLKSYPVFPNGPSTRSRTSTLKMRFTKVEVNLGMRIFGFLSPLESGSYEFELASSGSSELWISKDSAPDRSRLIANVTLNLNSKDLRRNIQLKAGNRYYIEVLHKHGDIYSVKNFMDVKWRFGDSNGLVEIPSKVLLCYDENFRESGQRPLFFHKHRDSRKLLNEQIEPPVKMYHLPFVTEEYSRQLFPPCQYNPSYILKGPLVRYQSTWEMRYTSIYPPDQSDVADDTNSNFISLGNDVLHEKEAETVISQVWTTIDSKNPGKYRFLRALNVEAKHDPGTGDRYLVELELKETLTGNLVRFSEYAYRPWGTWKLCSPEGVAWNKSVVVNILLTTGNQQGRWILHFLDNMEKIARETNDSSFTVIITDFDSQDINLEAVLRRSAIPNYVYVKIQDKFQRALGLQKAAEMVVDPNSIVFAMDLHLDIPPNFLDNVRKHCVQNKIVFAPMLVRLPCGATAQEPRGHWEYNGYGLIGMYKSDWDRVGGMNVEEFKKKWGGEDWEMCDRILGKGMEVDRLKMLHFYHYYHSKAGLWLNPIKTSH